MTNINKAIKGKNIYERGKKVWILKDKKGKILERFINKKIALETQIKYKKELFIETTLERENIFTK